MDIQETRTREHQDAFLFAFAKDGTILRAAKVSKTSRTTVYAWDKLDIYGFKERFELARHDFREVLEQIGIDVVKLGDEKNPLRWITLMNAHHPEKYRPNVVLVDDTAKNVLADMRERARARHKQKPTGEKAEELTEEALL